MWFTYLNGSVFESFWFGSIFQVLFCVGLFSLSLSINYNKFPGKIIEIIGGGHMCTWIDSRADPEEHFGHQKTVSI